MIQKKLQGTGVALVTPFTTEKQVDYSSLEKLLTHTIEGGVDFLVVFGTTGEPVTLSDQEKKDVLSFIASFTQKKLPLVVGCGSNNTAEIVQNVQEMDASICDAVLSVVPYYNKPTQEGIFEHYKAIASASDIPVIAYNVPSRTGCNLEAETVIRIAQEIPQVIGLKEASSSIEQFTYIKKGVPEDFLLISGDDSLILPHLALGANGAISVTANAIPAHYSKLIGLAQSNNFKDALALHLKLIEFTDSLFEEGSPSGVKAALKELGIMGNDVRLPLVPVTKKLEEKIKKLLGELPTV